jgi:kinesin family protein 6/9
MMTMCLRDSIGGNCKTRMIANLSSDFDDVFESLSTCRFAQRVALVKNTAVVNEVVDPNILIQKQKGEIEELKNELAMLKGKNQKSFLEKEDIDECKKIVEEFLKDETYTKKIEVKDRLMIQECFNIIKMKYKDMEKQVAMHVNKDEIVLNGTQDKERIIMLENENKRLNAEIDKLKEMLKNREDEMKVVLENMEQNKTQLSLSTINNNNNLNNTSMNGHRTLLSRIQQEDNEAISKIKNNILGDLVKFDSISNVQGNNDSTILLNLNDSSTKNDTNSVSAKSTTTYVDVPTPLIKDINSANSYITNPNSEEINIALFKQEGYAFNFFKANYYLREVEVENKEKIKNKMAEGKQLAAEYPKLEAKIEKIKKAIENVRKLKIVSEDSKDKVDEYTKQEETLLNEFTKIKPIRQSMRDKLKNMRNEITTMQTIDTNFQVTRIKNYEFWKETMLKKLDFESKHGKINLVTGKASIKA